LGSLGKSQCQSSESADAIFLLKTNELGQVFQLRDATLRCVEELNS